jgi:hypothetical protein
MVKASVSAKGGNSVRAPEKPLKKEKKAKKNDAALQIIQSLAGKEHDDGEIITEKKKKKASDDADKEPPGKPEKRAKIAQTEKNILQTENGVNGMHEELSLDKFKLSKSVKTLLVSSCNWA